MTRSKVNRRQRLAELFTVSHQPRSMCANSAKYITKTLPTGPWVNEMQAEFPDLFARKGRIKYDKIHARLHERTVLKQQKVLRVPIQLQEPVKKGNQSAIAKKAILLKENNQRCFLTGHNEYRQERSERQNSFGCKGTESKCCDLIDMIAEHVEQEPGKTFFTTLYLTYAHGQVELSATTSRQCNFQLIGGKARGICRSRTGFYGLTAMPTEFQQIRIMDLALAGITNTFAFTDDILIVTNGRAEEHITEVKEVLKRLNEANISLKLENCAFPAESIERVGYELSHQGIAPIKSKVHDL